ncbi:MAG: hypothetical protein M1479_07700 [Actinobacteria bacterium]|nr:hypothetical protein [Cyanobacteriota bacterium]MCL5772142.1 hypothetical protein [Actinomycetota bacterium]
MTQGKDKDELYDKRAAIEAKISEGKRMYGLNMRKLIRDIIKDPELMLRFAS